MSARVRLILTLAFICGTRTFAGMGAEQGTSCAALTALTIPDVAITSSTSVPAGAFAMPGGRPGAPPTTMPAFCRVVAVGTPSSDSHINFEVWIPEGAGWNGKFQGVDTGGFSGAITYSKLADGVRRGYATAATDAGHTGDDLAFGNGHPEKIVDWGLSVHSSDDRDRQAHCPQQHRTVS